MLCTFIVKALNVSITAVLSSWSDSSDISAESECGSDACCVLRAVMGFWGWGAFTLPGSSLLTAARGVLPSSGSSE